MRDASFLSAADPITVKAENAIEPLVVSLATAARLLGVSDRHVRSHLHEIPHNRIGGRLLFQVRSLRTWLEQCERNKVVTPQLPDSQKGGE